MGEIQAIKTSHSKRLLEHRGAVEKLEAEAAEKLQEVTKRHNARLLNGTINRIMRQQIVAGWNKWVASYHEDRLTAGLSEQLKAHTKELETQQLEYASGLEKALAAHEADKERELLTKMRELDELSASRLSDSEDMHRRVTELEGSHADTVSELEAAHADKVSEVESGYTGKVSELEAVHAERVAAVESKHAEEIMRRATKLESGHADRMSELESGHADKVSELEAAHAERVAAVESKHAEDMTRRATERESAHADRMSELEAAHADRFSEIEAAHVDNIASKTQELSEILKAAKERHAAAEAAHTETKAKHELLLESISQQHDATMRELKNTHEKAKEAQEGVFLRCYVLMRALSFTGPSNFSRTPPSHSRHILSCALVFNRRPDSRRRGAPQVARHGDG